MRQRPSTAKGITFVTLEDETGVANLIVHKATWDRCRRVARRAKLLFAAGRIERKGIVVHLIVDRLEDLTPLLAALRAPSRDFR